MADRYCDNNGTTAGFGTLTVTWNNTLATWSTSSAGTATPTAYIFTSADAAYFGSDAVSNTTSGTATIGTGTAITLNTIYTRNLSGTQTIAAAGTGNLVFAGTTPGLNAGRTLIISAPVSGSAGVTSTMLNSTGRPGAQGNTFTMFSGTSNGLTGACSVTGGRFIVAPTTTAARYSPSALNVSDTAVFEYYPMSNTDFTFSCAPTGAGYIAIFGNHSSGGGVTFSAGQLTSFAGIVRVEPDTFDSTYRNPKIRLFELPGGLDWAMNSRANFAVSGEFTYLGSAATYATNLTLDTFLNTDTTAVSSGVYSLIVPNTSGAIVITGTVQRLNTAGTASDRMNLTLGGSNTGDNTLSGVISEAGTNNAFLGLTKVDAGRWVISGNNTHTGVHSIQAGTLAANSATALGSATSTGGVIIIGTGVLELGNGLTLNKSVTDFSIGNATNPIQTTGTSTLQTKQVTLSVTPTFTVPSGRKLTIAPQGAGVIAGSGTGITKAGDGELELTAKANTYTGAVTVSAGTLTVGSVANGGSAAAWGQASSAVAVSATLKYNGAAGSSSRAVQMTGSAPVLDASGSGALTLSNVTQDTTAKTMTLRGTSTDANTISSAVANNSGAVSLAKEDAGKWVLSGALSYTGTTAVNGGTLRVETTNSNTTSGAVTIGASGTVELVTGTLASAGATSGEVLGTGNVTVNGGIIKTRGGGTQQGQVRYGGNLTFGSGSTLYIGAAA